MNWQENCYCHVDHLNGKKVSQSCVECVQVLWVCHTSGINAIFLYLASTESEQPYFMHILEVSKPRLMHFALVHNLELQTHLHRRA